ncbi:hypothetical protein D9M68_661830 [compost metagenome]
MNKLIESVLPVCAWLAPNDGAGFIIHRLAVSVHMLTVTFHVALLKISRKAMQVLVVGQNGLGFRMEEIDIPYA